MKVDVIVIGSGQAGVPLSVKLAEAGSCCPSAGSSAARELVHCFVVLMEAGASARAVVDARVRAPHVRGSVQSPVMALERYSK